MSKYYKAKDIQELITACMWRMTLAKERGGEGFVEYDKQIIDVGELRKRLNELQTIEVSDDCISREHLKSFSYINKGNFNSVEGIREWIENAPSVVQSRPYGEWLHVTAEELLKYGRFTSERWIDYKCSNCGHFVSNIVNSSEDERTKYCPNCGARMKGGAE